MFFPYVSRFYVCNVVSLIIIGNYSNSNLCLFPSSSLSHYSDKSLSITAKILNAHHKLIGTLWPWSGPTLFHTSTSVSKLPSWYWSLHWLLVCDCIICNCFTLQYLFHCKDVTGVRENYG